MTFTHCTETRAGIYRHLIIGMVRYPIAVELRGDQLTPVRNDEGHLLYATPGGGRMTASQLLAA